MARRVFRYRFDFGSDLVKVRAEGKTRRGGYYALAEVVQVARKGRREERAKAISDAITELKDNAR